MLVGPHGGGAEHDFKSARRRARGGGRCCLQHGDRGTLRCDRGRRAPRHVSRLERGAGIDHPMIDRRTLLAAAALVPFAPAMAQEPRQETWDEKSCRKLLFGARLAARCREDLAVPFKPRGGVSGAVGTPSGRSWVGSTEKRGFFAGGRPTAEIGAARRAHGDRPDAPLDTEMATRPEPRTTPHQALAA